jgi:hypothetical protein
VKVLSARRGRAVAAATACLGLLTLAGVMPAASAGPPSLVSSGSAARPAAPAAPHADAAGAGVVIVDGYGPAVIAPTEFGA